MTATPPPPQLQAYRLLVYRTIVHPEFFRITRKQRIAGDDYELESWLSHGTHMMRFQVGEYCVVEVMTPNDRGFPNLGRLATMPCAGEREHAQPIGDRIHYTTAVQSELLSESLFRSELLEIRRHGEENGGLLTQWWPDDRTNGESVSILCLQRFSREVHAQSWHFDSTCGLVVRSQALFEIRRPFMFS